MVVMFGCTSFLFYKLAKVGELTEFWVILSFKRHSYLSSKHVNAFIYFITYIDVLKNLHKAEN